MCLLLIKCIKWMHNGDVNSLCLQLPSTKLLHGFDKIWHCLSTPDLSSKFNLFSVGPSIHTKSGYVSQYSDHGFGLNGRGVRLRFPARDTDFSLFNWVQLGPEASQACYWVLEDFYSKLKRLGSVAGLSPASNDKAKCME
jgi:hypothetical protein